MREWQIIVNHHTCHKLQEKGDNLKLERAIEHKAYFHTKNDREKFITLVKKDKFNAQEELDVPFNKKIMYGIQFYRKDIPFYYDIDLITMQLLDYSETCNGQYDGWESPLVK